MCPIDVCHPNDLRAPAPRALPIASRWLPSGETPRSLGLRTAACASGDRTFHDVRDRFGGSSSRANLPLSTSRPGVGSVGVFFPRRASDRASDTPVANCVHRHASPGFPGAALFPWPRVSLLERLARVGRCAFRRDPLSRRLVKGDASADPGCLLSTGTLPRIRWPLRPRSHDRLTAFRAIGRPLNGTLAPPWVFVRSLPVHTGEAETPTYLSLPAPNDGVTRRPSSKARPPFTRPCSLFWSADRAYSRPDAA